VARCAGAWATKTRTTSVAQMINLCLIEETRAAWARLGSV
jgi:hypothetical protein